MVRSRPREREKNSRAAAPTSHATEYSTRILARRTEINTMTMSTTLNAVIAFRRRSKSYPPRLLRSAPLVLQHVDEHSQQHMNNIVNRFHRRNGGASGPPGQHVASYLDEAKPAPL